MNEQERILDSQVVSTAYDLLFFFPSLKGHGFSGVARIKIGFSSPRDWVNLNFEGYLRSLDSRQTVTGTEGKGHRVRWAGEVKEVELALSFQGSFQLSQFSGFFVVEMGEESVMYSQGEPFCVDQIFPNLNYTLLKAPFRVSVIAESQYSVFANAGLVFSAPIEESLAGQRENSLLREIARLEEQGQLVGKGLMLWEFAWFDRVPVHLFALVVGRFASWRRRFVMRKVDRPWNNLLEAVELVDIREAKPGESMGLLELGILIPPQLTVNCMKNVEDYFFDFSKHAVEMLVSLFDLEWPFAKLDWVFGRLKFNAMENPGLVIAEQSNLLPQPPFSVENLNRVRMIIHELCHMYWGNLVSLGDWSSVWIKEAVTEYWSRVCIRQHFARSPEFDLPLRKLNSMLAWISIVTARQTPHKLAYPPGELMQEEHFYSQVVYHKGATIFFTIEKAVGFENWVRFFREFVREFRSLRLQTTSFFEKLFDHLQRTHILMPSQQILCFPNQIPLRQLLEEILDTYCREPRLLSCYFESEPGLLRLRNPNETSVFATAVAFNHHGEKLGSKNVFFDRKTFVSGHAEVQAERLGLPPQSLIFLVVEDFGGHALLPELRFLTELLEDKTLNILSDPVIKFSILAAIKRFYDVGLPPDLKASALNELSQDRFSHFF